MFLQEIRGKSKYFEFAILFVIYLLTVGYSFLLAYKRYLNFEYGKFDLGNMTQMLHNTLHGDFMVLTDQFGTNMPRWGMSHVDPIILLIIPLYLIVSSPMTLVFAQHLVILSAIFPLYWITKKYTRSSLIAFIMVIIYILYPANGYTLVWTGYHGISFVAPLLIWVFWFLNKNDYLVNTPIKLDGNINKRNLLKRIIYWTLIVFMLLGKEEIGAILFLASIFLYFRNSKLAIQTGVISLIWFVVAFFIIIPHYSHVRQESIDNFVRNAYVEDYDRSSAEEENFFFFRYSYLGDSYGKMVKTLITKLTFVYQKVVDESKKDTLLYLLGPFVFFVITGLFWVVALPDLAITFLSNEPIFNIYNHRMAFVTVSLFISQLFIFMYISKSNKLRLERKKFLFYIYAFVLLIATVYFSNLSNNPLYVSGKGFVESKIISRVFASNVTAKDFVSDYKIGDVRKSSIPNNNKECLNNVVGLVIDKNPSTYTGPDYLGDHTSMRQVNALFPARSWDAEMVVSDIFEIKTLGPLGESSWLFNKDNLNSMLKSKKFKHIYSCGRVNVFYKGNPKDYSEVVERFSSNEVYDLSSKHIKMKVGIVQVPKKIEVNYQENEPIVLELQIIGGDFNDKVTYFTFESAETSDKISFIDYLTLADENNISYIEQNSISKEHYHIVIPSNVDSGMYNVFYGVGDLLRSRELYIGSVYIR